ncbi:MAG: inorganic phosphate transporter [Methanomassiliicoccales archaeon]
MEFLAVAGIVLALAFTFTNGFQDASSVAATFIASRSAKPRQGIILVASMDFLGAMLGGSAVAFTLAGLLLIEPGEQALLLLLTALIASTAWNLMTYFFSLPSSSTHAIIGGLIGAAVAAKGMGSVLWGWEELFTPNHQLIGLVRILSFLFISIIIGLMGGYLAHKIAALSLRNAKTEVNRKIIKANWVVAAGMAFFNGANDAQKQLGVIALIMFSAGMTSALEVELWARIACASLLGLGTLMGGWRVMRTLGSRIFLVRPIHSLESQAASAASIAFSTLYGAPISSTHVISSSIMGVGAAENPTKVRWSVGKEIVISWVLTIPVTMTISACLYLLLISLVFVGGR